MIYNKKISSINFIKLICSIAILLTQISSRHVLTEKLMSINNKNYFSKRNNDDDEVFKLKKNGPLILTKYAYIVSYEHYTVVLPCDILNLPNDMHVIWQYGKREQDQNQIVLTIGRTQIENNYRLRVISNSTDDEKASFDTFNYIPNGLDKSISVRNSEDQPIVPSDRVTSNNLEIRKLRLSDSGWYECQLPTKPTQKNYVYLEVLGFPKIETNTKHPKPGDHIELMCQVKNLPSRYELHWILNDKKLDVTTINKQFTKNKRNMDNRRHMASYTITNEKHKNNITISKLRIKNLDDIHKGVYKCKYDKVEAKFHLDFKSNNKARSQSYDHIYSNSTNKTVNASLFLILSMFLVCILRKRVDSN